MKSKIKVWINYCAFIWQFALDDLKNKYSGSALGITWAFIQPIITIILYWFVFQLGFKSQPVADFPFILWLLAGLVPWFFFSDAISNATGSLREYNYLVKKVLFNINILPLAKVLSTLLIQFVLIIFAVIFYCLWGHFPDIYYLQLLPYLIYMVVLSTGIVYLTSTLYVFFKDALQIISIVLQVVFWLTPIVWTLDAMPESIQGILKYNPMYYVVSGYRNAFVGKVKSLWDLETSLYYWCIAFFILALGLWLFNRCKKHFADIL